MLEISCNDFNYLIYRMMSKCVSSFSSFSILLLPFRHYYFLLGIRHSITLFVIYLANDRDPSIRTCATLMDFARDQQGWALFSELTKHPFTFGDNTFCTLDKVFL